MAENSIREQLIEAVKTQLETLSAIKTVQRLQPTLNDLSAMAGPQLPFIAIAGQLPNPVPKVSGRAPGRADKFRSVLAIDIFCYALDNIAPDTLVSDLADDIWAVLLVDQTWGKLAIETVVTPELKVGRWAPYIMFKMRCDIKYVHGIGGL